MSLKSFSDINVDNRTVVLRLDLNVPLDGDAILSDARIQSALPTVQLLMQKRAKVIIMSHLGRPKGFDAQYSLKVVAEKLSEYLKIPVPLFSLDQKPPVLQPGQVALLENVRFYSGETENDEPLAHQYARLGAIFVMDAFAVSHRKHASTYGVILQSQEAVMGPLLASELQALNNALQNPESPVVAIVGGGKVSTKLAVLNNLIEKVDTLIVGGAIANTFLKARGVFVGASLVEEELIETAKEILEKAKANSKQLWLPSDVIVAAHIDDETVAEKSVDELSAADCIFDIGAKSRSELAHILKEANTIIWNGPVGVFEKPQFAQGTKALGKAVAASKAFSIAGGGETIAAIEQAQVSEEISQLSTGGGAFLALLEGNPLPAITALDEKSKTMTSEVSAS